MAKLRVLFSVCLAILLFAACSDDTDSDGTTDTGVTGGDTGTVDTGTADTGTEDTGAADTGTADTGTEDTGTVGDVVSGTEVALTGDLSLSTTIEATTEGGGFVVFLLPDGYVVTGDPTGDVIAALIIEVENGYTGEVYTLEAADGILSVWDEDSGGSPIGDSWEGVVGDYVLFIGFMSNFDEGDQGPSHISQISLTIDSVPSVVDFDSVVMDAMGGE